MSAAEQRWGLGTLQGAGEVGRHPSRGRPLPPTAPTGCGWHEEGPELPPARAPAPSSPAGPPPGWMAGPTSAFRLKCAEAPPSVTRRGHQRTTARHRGAVHAVSIRPRWARPRRGASPAAPSRPGPVPRTLPLARCLSHSLSSCFPPDRPFIRSTTWQASSLVLRGRRHELQAAPVPVGAVIYSLCGAAVVALAVLYLWGLIGFPLAAAACLSGGYRLRCSLEPLGILAWVDRSSRPRV